mgnify:FL=1
MPKIFEYPKPSIEIFDNFLEPHIFEQISKPFIDPFADNVPWSKGPVIYQKGVEEKYNCQLSHLLYHELEPKSKWAMITMHHFLKKLEIQALLKAKVNFNPCIGKILEHTLHIDLPFPHWTGIFYMNTNDGYTLCEDGTKINSVENRLAILPWKTYHTGTSCSDMHGRVTLNFNWMVQNELSTSYQYERVPLEDCVK